MLEHYITHMKWCNIMLCVLTLLMLAIGTLVYALMWEVKNLTAENKAMVSVCSQFVSSGELTIKVDEKD